MSLSSSMRRLFLLPAPRHLVPMLLAAQAGFAADPGAPLLTYAYLEEHVRAPDAASIIVAKVQDDPITLRELGAALSRAHAGHDQEGKVARIDFGPVLDRVIAARLIAA